MQFHGNKWQIKGDGAVNTAGGRHIDVSRHQTSIYKQPHFS